MCMKLTSKLVSFFRRKTKLNTEKKSPNIVFYNSKVLSKILLPFIMQSIYAAFAICTARKNLCFKKLSAMGFSVK